jgi:hypothetical protein
MVEVPFLLNDAKSFAFCDSVNQKARFIAGFFVIYA